MIFTLDNLRPKPNYPTYPPYHNGDYIEDYFYNKFINENPIVSRNYIAISWTTLYCENKDFIIQSFLNNLDPSLKYFTVLQHDDAPRHILPPNTLCFSAGGNVSGSNIIPIPLVCSKLPEIDTTKEKIYTASFVGSATHRIRIKLAQQLISNSKYKIMLKNWSPHVDQLDFETFLDVSLQSKFIICPRGYGLNSFRLYEAFQLNRVPVIVTDKEYLPWADELKWNIFSVLIKEDDICNIEKIIDNISDEQYNEMLNEGKKIYKNYFTLDGVYKNIIKRLK